MSAPFASSAGVSDVRRHECRVFNSHVVLTTAGEGNPPFVQTQAWLDELERRFSRFRDDNELAELNASAGSWVQVGTEMARLLEHSLRVFIASAGLVNIAVTRALQRAGYRESWPKPWSPHSLGSAPEKVRPLTEVLECSRGRARLQPGVSVDFGAIAKGLWADDVVEGLGPNAAASLGGDVSARGAGPQGSGWPLRITTGETLLVRDGGVATSGVTKRRSGSAHHVIDPRTGLPAAVSTATTTVLARTASSAEWLATALLIDPSVPGVLDHPDLLATFTTPLDPED
jgi:thiamine biosynthesis lipoprotein